MLIRNAFFLDVVINQKERETFLVEPVSSAAMSNPRAACGPVEGFVRPSLGVRCSENILHTDNLPLFS